MGRRFFDPQSFSSGQAVRLGEDASHHIGRVLRMRPNDTVTLFNGEGGEWQATITEISKQAVTVIPEQFSADDRIPPWFVTVALPAIKGDRMDVAIQKATEMGARAFQLLDTEYSDVRLQGERLEKKLGHWQRVAISACEQCGMNRIPPVLAPISLAAAIEGATDQLKLYGHPQAQPLARACRNSTDRMVLFTGPEGGFSDAEYHMLEAAGAQAVTLGERVLRAETAPVAILAGLAALAGRD